MRRGVLVAVAVVLGGAFAACRTTQPPGTENATPIQGAGDVNPGNIVPAEPPGPTGPLTFGDAGTPVSPPP